MTVETEILAMMALVLTTILPFLIVGLVKAVIRR